MEDRTQQLAEDLCRARGGCSKCRGQDDDFIGCYFTASFLRDRGWQKPRTDIKYIRAFFNGEWVDTKIVQEMFNISFKDGMSLFAFSRTAEWNPAPQNGQNITTKFKLKSTPEIIEKLLGRLAWVIVRDGEQFAMGEIRKIAEENGVEVII